MGTRRLLLLRHGQYDEDGDGRLTAIGREQGGYAAAELAREPIDRIRVSTLIRARETAEIAAKRHKDVPLRAYAVLCEAIPTKLPPHLARGIDPAQIARDIPRAKRAAAELFRPTKTDRTELVVCHGNIIRYFHCLALGVEPEAWVRLISHHCGISEIIVQASGQLRAVRYNDLGHLPRALRTMSNAATMAKQSHEPKRNRR
ncbi:hypothetical protein BH09MYX1_BH09MYX1_64520 [soil metagenome]